MARSKSKTFSPPTPKTPKLPYALPDKAEWGGFINIRLSEDQRNDFFAWYEANFSAVGNGLDELVGLGLKTTFSFDSDHNSYICSVTGALLSEEPDVRFCSTSRASTLTEVIALTYWKHSVLAKGDYGRYRPKDGTFMNWG